MQKIKLYQQQAQQSIDRLITTAEVEYNALTSITFTYAGQFANVLRIKGFHDKLSYITFGKARELNEQVGSKTAGLIVQLEKL